MDNLGLLERIREDSAVLVAGKDMFGAQFTERTKLMELSAQRLVFALYRPLVEDLTLRVNLRSNQEEAGFWVKGIVTKVKNRLDGMQTVEMKALEVSVLQAESSSADDLQDKPTASPGVPSLTTLN